MTFHDGFLSEMIGRTAVVTESGRRRTVGRISDFVVERPDDTFPKIDALVIKSKNGKHLAPIGTILDFDVANKLILSEAPTTEAPPDDEALYLVEDLFDKQIVDVDGRKVVRINDIEVARTGGALRVVAADIGLRRHRAPPWRRTYRIRALIETAFRARSSRGITLHRCTI